MKVKVYLCKKCGYVHRIENLINLCPKCWHHMAEQEWEEEDYIDEEEEKLGKYLSKEFINYSKYRIDGLRLSKLPNKIDE